MAQFRPYPEEGVDVMGKFSPTKFLRDSISHGPLHFMSLVPHVLIPIYGIYRLMKQSGYWTPGVDYAIEALLIPLLQGLSLGGVLSITTMRYILPEGRRVANKRADASATDSEDTSQHRLEMALWGFVYLGFATILWQRFPAADGPGLAAFKRLAGRVGVDLGETWRTRSWQS